MPFTQGSLAEYDILIQITGQSINNQLKTLYDTPVKDTLDPDLPDVPADGDTHTSFHRQKFLIDHLLTIHDVEDGVEDPDSGLFAHIESPVLSFKDSDTVLLTFKFRSDDTYPAGEQLSEMREWVGKRKPKLIRRDISGWSMSFEAQLHTKDITDRVNDIVNQAKSPRCAVGLPKAAQRGLKKVSSKVFLVSTIFCAFQSATIARNFELRTPEGELFTGEGSTGLMERVSNYFSAINNQVPGKGLEPGAAPTPKNPYVLGYGISQDLKAREAHPKYSTRKTPRALIPASFGFGASPDYGTFNFGLLTYRDNPALMRSIDKNDKNAGVPDEDYFQITKCSKDAHDGLMAISQIVFMKEYVVKQICDALWTTPKESFISMWNSLDFHNMDFYGKQGGHKETWHSPTQFERCLTWQTDHKERPAALTRDRRSYAEGASYLLCKVYSDLSPDSGPPIEGNKDDQRRVYIHIWSIVRVKYVDEYDKVFSGWSLDRSIELWSNFEYLIEFKASDKGAWSARLVQGKIHPDPAKQGKPYCGVPMTLDRAPKVDILGFFKSSNASNPIEPGLFINRVNTKNLDLKDVIKAFGLPGLVISAFMDYDEDQVSKNLEGLTNAALSTAVGSLAQTVATFLNKMNTTIMLPAGDAFTFNGMDTDLKGNLFAHINYDTPMSGRRTGSG